MVIGSMELCLSLIVPHTAADVQSTLALEKNADSILRFVYRITDLIYDSEEACIGFDEFVSTVWVGLLQLT